MPVNTAHTLSLATRQPPPGTAAPPPSHSVQPGGPTTARPATRAVSAQLPAVVLGLEQNGLGVVRALARHGVPVVAVDGHLHSSCARTRYCRKVGCSDFRGAGLIDTLEQLGRQLAAAVLIPTMDHTVLLASEHRARLEPYYRHFLPPDAVIQQLMNKASIYDYAVAHGFQMPKTWVVQCQADLERCLDELQLPCILKPQVKTRGFLEHRTAKAFLLPDADAVRRTYAHLAQGEPRVVVQQWIPGPDTNLIFCLYYFDERGEPLASFTGRKIRQFIPYCGTAASAEPWEDAWVREAGIRFFQAAGYRGLAAIEFKIDQRDGAYHLMEPTVGRTEHLCALAAANGVNLPLTAWCDLAGQPLPPVERVRRPVRYVDRQRDRRAYRHYRAAGELTWRQWRQSLRGPKQRALAAWDDPGPLLHAVMAPGLRKARRLYQLTVGRLVPTSVPSPASRTSPECDEN